MMTAIGVYVVGSYVLAGVMLGSGGPGGLGWLAFPLAPILPPFLLYTVVKTRLSQLAKR